MAIESFEFCMPAFALPLVAAVVLPAQSFVVDAANGPGAVFTSLVAAVAAVPDGAVLLVRAGAYAPFTIDDKSLTILADPAVTVVDMQGLVIVRNLASQRRVTMRGFAIQGLLAPARLRCQGNAGLVSIEQCRPQGALGLVLEATQCDQLRVVDCTFNAVGAVVTLTGSQVAFVNTDFPLTSITDAGLRQSGGSTELVDCDVFGFGFPTGVPVQFLAPGTVRLLGSTRLLNAQPRSRSFGATAQAW